MAGKFKMNELFNDQSLADLQACTFEIRPIDIDRLTPSKKNLYSIENIEELAANILDCGGLLEYPRVSEADKNGKHEIVSGHRRYHACKLLVEWGYEEYKTIPCHIDGCQDPDLVELKLISANAQARVLTDAEKAYQAERLTGLYEKLKSRGVPIKGRIRDRVAREMGVSPAQIGRYKQINENLSEGLREELKAGRIGITNAYDLSKLPEEEQGKALDTLKATGEIKAAKKPKQTAPKEQAAPVAVDIQVQKPEKDTDSGRVIVCPHCHKEFVPE